MLTTTRSTADEERASPLSLLLSCFSRHAPRTTSPLQCKCTSPITLERQLCYKAARLSPTNRPIQHAYVRPPLSHYHTLLLLPIRRYDPHPSPARRQLTQHLPPPQTRRQARQQRRVDPLRKPPTDTSVSSLPASKHLLLFKQAYRSQAEAGPAAAPGAGGVVADDLGEGVGVGGLVGAGGEGEGRGGREQFDCSRFVKYWSTDRGAW